MVMRYGMDEKLGPATYAEQQSPFLVNGGMPQIQSRIYSEKTAREIDEAVRELVGKSFEQATAILERNRQLLNETAERLLTKETLSADELPQPVWENETVDKQRTSE
jgi:cell division protease FtsH